MSEKTRVMLVDDEEIVLKRLRPALEKCGYEVETFADGETALVKLQEEPFDVVVTDVRMVGVSGIQILERVMAARPQTKVIIITGYATLEMARETLLKGAFDFLAKPFKPDDLRQAIERATREQGSAQ